MKLVSACLIGIKCAYYGKSRTNRDLLALFQRGELIPVCPEQLGGLTTPRLEAEIYGGTGKNVIEKKAKVIEKDGTDVTQHFIRGAYEVLYIAKKIGIKEAILKARGPSCGCGRIYDGTFSGTLVDGDGVTTALLKMYGIQVKSTEEVYLSRVRIGI